MLFAAIGLIVALICGIAQFGFTKFGLYYFSSLFLLGSLLFLQTWVAIGRTLFFDRNGITVKFLIFTKTYTWKELKTKRIENYSDRLRINHAYNKAAVFSPKIIRNPLKLYPINYNIFAVLFTNPFKYMFIYFDPYHGQKKFERDMPYTYMVDEAEFKKCMRDWHIDIENL